MDSEFWMIIFSQWCSWEHRLLFPPVPYPHLWWRIPAPKREWNNAPFAQTATHICLSQSFITSVILSCCLTRTQELSSLSCFSQCILVLSVLTLSQFIPLHLLPPLFTVGPPCLSCHSLFNAHSRTHNNIINIPRGQGVEIILPSVELRSGFIFQLLSSSC